MKMLKELKWEAILTGVLYILLGIVALLIPETMQKTLGYLIGIVLIVAGLISIICYLLRDARENYYHNEFVFGILGIVLGAVVLYKVEIVISLIPFILGVLSCFVLRKNWVQLHSSQALALLIQKDKYSRNSI